MKNKIPGKPKRGGFIKKTINIPEALKHDIEEWIADPEFRGQFSNFITRLLVNYKRGLEDERAA